MPANRFHRSSKTYSKYSDIQKMVVQKIVEKIEKKNLGNVLDLGCGEGAVYRELIEQSKSFEKFYGVDLAEGMLNLHPKGDNIELFRGSFDDIGLLKSFKDIDTVISSSALQWSSSLTKTLEIISNIGYDFYFSIFTSNTFKTLHKIANIESPIYSVDEILYALQKYYKVVDIEIKEYKKEFSNTRELLNYIRKSGVNGGGARLGYREIKTLLNSYPINYLEFEVLFFRGYSI